MPRRAFTIDRVPAVFPPARRLSVAACTGGLLATTLPLARPPEARADDI